MKISKKRTAGQIVADTFLLLIGSAISAFVMNMILVPNHIAPGGAGGLAIVINYLTNNFISTGMLIILINIPLFIIGLKVFGKIFALKSIVGTIAFSVMVDLFKTTALNLGEKWFEFSKNTNNVDLLLFTIYGGVLLGVGFGLVIRGGASTGGSSLGAQLLNNWLPHIPIGTWLLIIDAFVIVFAAVAFDNIVYALYSIIVIWISSNVMSVVIDGLNNAKAVYIISDSADKIKEELLYKLKRGVTTLAGKGAYSGSEKDVLLCVVPHVQIHELKRIVSGIDERAFIILSDAKEVLGEGFRE